MNLQRQSVYRESLRKVYGDYNDTEDGMNALIALLAKERDEHEEKIEIMEAHYKEVIQEYKNAVAMWKDQAQSSLELLKMQQGESCNKSQTKHLIEG